MLQIRVEPKRPLKRLAQYNPMLGISRLALSILAAWTLCITTAGADSPPVRIAVVPAGGSGIEQDVVDRISNQLESIDHVSVSTVNPDWYVVCNIQERMDQMSGQIRYNGTVTVKTIDGQVISNVAVQKYNQDFSLTPGAPLNKALVDGAAREVISGMAERALGPIEQAVQTEVDTRNRVGSAIELAQQDKFDEAMSNLSVVTPDSPHFKQVRALMAQFAMEKQALASLNAADALAKKGNYAGAINSLKSVDKHSKRYKLAQEKISSYRAKSAPAVKLAKTKVPGAPATAKHSEAQSHTASTPNTIEGIEGAKKVLQMQEQALEAKKSALQMQEAVEGPGNKRTK